MWLSAAAVLAKKHIALEHESIYGSRVVDLVSMMVTIRDLCLISHVTSVMSRGIRLWKIYAIYIVRSS
jgi:hypothetical protein